MDSQQSDPSQLIPETSLNPAESISVTSLDHQNFQDESSQIQKRMLISDRQGSADSDPTAQNSQFSSPIKSVPEEKSRLKELDSYFGKFYQIAMAINILAAVGNLITMTVLLAKGSMYDYSYLLFVGLALAQFLLAFSGMRKRNLGRITKALRLMEVYLGCLILTMMIKAYPGKFEGIEDASFSTENFLRSMVVIGIHIGINILPTIRVKNILKEEEKAEKPWSWYLRFYQVWVLLYFFQTLLKVIYFVFLDFAGVQVTLESMKSDANYLCSILLLVFLGPLKLRLFYLLFQGMRKKNLESILTAMKLIKVSLVIGVGLNVLKYIALSHQERVGKLSRDFSEIVYEGLGEFMYEEVVSRFAFALALIYGAWQVCDVLRRLHSESRIVVEKVE